MTEWFRVEVKSGNRWTAATTLSGKAVDSDTEKVAEAQEFFYGLGHPNAVTRIRKMHESESERCDYCGRFPKDIEHHLQFCEPMR